MKTIHPQFLSVKNSQLVVIDIQEKLFHTMSDEGQSALLKNTPILLAAARELNLPTIITEQYPKGIGPTIDDLQEGISGFALVEKVEFAATEVDRFNSLVAASGRKQVILCGMESHICVYQTALGLRQQGYEVHIAADALATRDPQNHLAALDLMRQAGCIIGVTEGILFQLLEKAGTAAFKKLQKLII